MLNKYRDANVIREVAPFKVDGLSIRYPEFVARLDNLCKDDNDRCLITVKNSFINFVSNPVAQGLVLRLNNIVAEDSMGVIRPFTSASTTQTYEVSEPFRRRLDDQGYTWLPGGGQSIGNLLTSDLFYFRQDFHETDDSILLERNLTEQDVLHAKLVAQSPENLDQIDLKENIRRILKTPRLDIRSSK
jgi:hypothetical protein